MPFVATKHRFSICCYLPFLLLAACHKTAPLVAPSNLHYSNDSAIVLIGVPGASVIPWINWHGHTGTFSFAGPVQQGITIDDHSGKISWTGAVPVDTYILPVQADNGDSVSDMASYTLTVSGKIVTVAGSTSGFSGDGGDALHAQMNQPADVAADAQNDIFIADQFNNRIRKITPDGMISTIAGDGTERFGGDGGPASAARLNLPNSLFSDSMGNLYVTDGGNGRIRKIDAGGIITTVAGSGDTTDSIRGDGGPAILAGLSLVAGKVALDAQGSLYISDFWNNLVRKVTPDGIIHTVAGNGGYGGVPLPDGLDALQAPIYAPWGVYWGGTANSLYIAALLGFTIFRLTDGHLYVFAGGLSSYPTFQSPVGDDGPATHAIIHSPRNVVADKAGNLYYADTYIGRIRRIDTRGIITTVAGNGTGGFSGDGGPAVAAQLNTPAGLAIDANGDLYIADTGNNRIRKVILH